MHELPLQFDELLPNVETALAASREMNESTRLEQVLLYGLSIGAHTLPLSFTVRRQRECEHSLLATTFPVRACSLVLSSVLRARVSSCSALLAALTLLSRIDLNTRAWQVTTSTEALPRGANTA
jgi:hypothetical protein